jgi:leucyl-tRNA synthetase
MGLLHYDEPFIRLFNQGNITSQHHKMSKSKGNVVNPDDYVKELGADTVRAYLMFIGPWDQGGDWDDSGISGLTRWFNRIWSLALEPYEGKAPCSAEEPNSSDLKRVMHQTIGRVSNDMEKLHFNTMLAALMEYSNFLSDIKEAGSVEKTEWDEGIRTLLLLLAPTAPHITEEIWSRLGYEYSIHNQAWPAYNEAMAQDVAVPLIVQVNGKLRDKIMVVPDITRDEAERQALASPKIQAFLTGRIPLQVIYVAGKLINLVVK